MLLPLRFNNKSSVIQTNFVAYKERKKYVTNVLPHTPNSEWMSVVAHKPHIFFFFICNRVGLNSISPIIIVEFMSSKQVGWVTWRNHRRKRNSPRTTKYFSLCNRVSELIKIQSWCWCRCGGSTRRTDTRRV